MTTLRKTLGKIGRFAAAIRHSLKRRIRRTEINSRRTAKVTVVTEADLDEVLGKDWRTRLQTK